MKQWGRYCRWRKRSDGGGLVIVGLLPRQVRHAEAFADPTDEALFPEEEQYVANAVDKRRREFATVRACARSALRDLGYAAVPILPGMRGAPCWPAGVVGSMTHCEGYRAAAVALGNEVRSVGIDAEPNTSLPDGILDAVSSPRERHMVQALGRVTPSVCWDKILFSAKESVYKVWSPLAETFLDFHDAEIRVDPPIREGSNIGTFYAELLVAGPWPTGRLLEGRWCARNGLIGTAIVVRSRSAMQGMRDLRQ
ncbi:4'-phosphopantetheinyl transferase superfamily protein [Streptomyces sp. tea 10]|nr:4'-phosphopantetheinyl transferase superfamily protein [Streptomyces sp. tea 10]